MLKIVIAIALFTASLVYVAGKAIDAATANNAQVISQVEGK